MGKRKRQSDGPPPAAHSTEEQPPPAKKTKARLQCSYCTKSYTEHQHYNKHVEKHHPEKCAYFCEHCPKPHPTFHTTGRLRQHVKVEHSDKLQGPGSCPYCDSHLTDHATLVRHIEKQHPDKCEHICTRCPDPRPRFYTEARLEKHHAEHLGRSGSAEKASCPTCNKPMTSLRILEHMRLFHPEKCQHVCELCPQPYPRFYTALGLRHHVSKNHESNVAKAKKAQGGSKERESCPICEKSMAAQQIMPHIRIYHSEECLHVCELCPQPHPRYYTAFGLQDHVARIHESNAAKYERKKVYDKGYQAAKSLARAVESSVKTSKAAKNAFKPPKKMQTFESSDSRTITLIRNIFLSAYRISQHNLGQRFDPNFALELGTIAGNPNLTISDLVTHPQFGEFRRVLSPSLVSLLNDRRETERNEIAHQFLRRPYILDLEGQGNDVFRQVPIVGDGNCFFRALSAAVFGNQHFYQTIRNIMGAMYGAVTGRHGYAMDQALAALRGGEYHELQEWSRRSSTLASRHNADLESQLFAGDGYWGSHDAAFVFSDAFPAHLLIVYELEFPSFPSLTEDPSVVIAAIRGDINAPPERQIHILHDTITSHYQLLIRMESNHINDLRNVEMLDERRDPLWAQRVFEVTDTPQAHVPNIIPAQDRLDYSLVGRGRSIARRNIAQATVDENGEEDDEEAVPSDEQGDRPTRRLRLPIPRIVFAKTALLPRGSAAQGLRIQLISEEHLGPITAAELLESSGRPPLLVFGANAKFGCRILDLCDASPEETQKQRDSRRRAYQLLRQLDPQTSQLIEDGDAIQEMNRAWLYARVIPEDVDEIDPEWPADRKFMKELGINDRNVLYPEAEQVQVVEEDWRPGEFELGEDEEGELSFSTLGEEDWPDSDNETLPRAPQQYIDELQQAQAEVEDEGPLEGLRELIDLFGNTLIVIGRFSGTVEQDIHMEQLMAHDIVANDCWAMRAVHRLQDPTLRDIPYANNRWRIMVNNMSADTAVPTENGVNVSPEHLQLINIFDQHAALGVNSGRIDVLIRGISGWSVASDTWNLFYQKYSGLSVFLHFALRQNFIDDYENNLPTNDRIRWINNRNISPCGMYYTQEVAPSELANAELNDPAADGMAVDLLALFRQERMARRAQMGEDESNAIFHRSSGRNEYTL